MLLARQEDGEVAKWQKSVSGSTTLVEHYSILSPSTSVSALREQSRVSVARLLQQ